MKETLKVWYGSMPESNGKNNWTAILYRDDDIESGITLARSEYPDRVRYEADKMRFMIGEITKEPDILTYDDKLHSGYSGPISDGQRYQHLMEKVTMRRADSDGPECPMLLVYADIWNEQPNKTAKQRIQEVLDNEISLQKSQQKEL